MRGVRAVHARCVYRGDLVDPPTHPTVNCSWFPGVTPWRTLHRVRLQFHPRPFCGFLRASRSPTPDQLVIGSLRPSSPPPSSEGTCASSVRPQGMHLVHIARKGQPRHSRPGSDRGPFPFFELPPGRGSSMSLHRQVTGKQSPNIRPGVSAAILKEEFPPQKFPLPNPPPPVKCWWGTA